MQLTRYDNAKKWISEYKSVDELKDYIDKAVAVELYAKQANDMDLEWDAARARVRAERKCGELLAGLEKGSGSGRGNIKDLPTGENVLPDSEYKKAKDGANLSDKKAASYQKLAAVPEAEFERAVDSPAAKPSTNHILKPKEEKQPRINADSLYIWGVLREFRSRGLFSQDLDFLVDEWTEAMKEDAASIIPKLKTWIDNYEK